MEVSWFEIIALLGSNIIVAIITIVVNRILNKKENDLDIAEKIRNQYKAYIRTLEATLERLTQEIHAATESSKEDKEQVKLLTDEVGELKDKVSKLYNQKKQDQELLNRWEESDRKKDLIIEDQKSRMAELMEEIEKNNEN